MTCAYCRCTAVVIYNDVPLCTFHHVPPGRDRHSWQEHQALCTDCQAGEPFAVPPAAAQ